MKKFFLFSAVALAACMASAQPNRALTASRVGLTPSRPNMQMMKADPSSLMRNVQRHIATDDQATVTPRRAAENNLYYSKPAGALYYHYDAEFRGYYPTIVTVAPFVEFTYVDCSTPAATKWEINGQDITEYVEGGTFTSSMEYGYGMNNPVISNRKGSFQLGENNEDNATYPSQLCSWGMTMTMGMLDDHAGYYAWGSLDNDNLFGTGAINDSPCVGIVQDYPKPATPLYCESVLVPAISISGNIGTIYMEIYNTESDSTEPVYTLVATDEDVVFNEMSTRNGKQIHFVKAQFNNIVTDEDGFESQEPFILDFASEVVITWEEGSDFGAMGNDIQIEDNADFTYINSNGEEDLNYALFAVNYPDGVKYHYYKGLGLYMSFLAYQDMVNVAATLYDQAGNEYNDCNVVKISDDGESAENVNDGWVMIQVAATDLENYEIDSEYDLSWLTIYYDTTGMSEKNTFYMTFRAEPLPADVAGRGGEIFVQGRGVKNVTPIVVYQGEYDPAAIKGVNKDAEKEDDAIYNLQGVKVAKSTEELGQGIYIRNGKKIVK